MTSISLQYTLHSVVSHMFIDVIEQRTLIHRNRSIDPIIQQMELAGIWSIMLRGSCIFLKTYSDVKYPKNVGDIDCNIIASSLYNKEVAQKNVEIFFSSVVDSLGWSLIEDDRPIIHHKNHPTHQILIEKKYLLDKSRWFIHIQMSHNDLCQILIKKEFFQLKPRDILYLEDAIQIGKNVDFCVPLNCIFRFYTTDLRISDIHGNTLESDSKIFCGMSCYSPLSQLVEKLACINIPYRNKAIDIIDAYNLIMILKHQPKPENYKKLRQIVVQNMYQDTSRFKRESIINALHAVDVDLAIYILQNGTVPEILSLQYNREIEEIWYQQIQADFDINYLTSLPTREIWHDICQNVLFWSIAFLSEIDHDMKS